MVFLLGCVASLPAQTVVEQLRPQFTETGQYQRLKHRDARRLYMAFADHRIRNPEDWTGQMRHVRQVDLAFTRYPRSFDQWEINYDSLLNRRFRALETLVPGILAQPGITWRVVLQTDCYSMMEAQELFHGFVIYLDSVAPPVDTATVLPPEVRAERFDTVRLRANADWIRRMMDGEETHHDSTGIKVLQRHPEWEDLLVVVDWTASMFRHGAQVMRWLEEQGARDRIGQLVFFNDGDKQWDDEKVVGATGGIYVCATGEMDTVVAVMERVALGGSGGDHRENDMEAVLHGLALRAEQQELVLIADNGAPVRDLRLLREVDVPVRVVLCGVYHEDIHPDYLTIADYTGGSIHTKDQDYAGFRDQMQQGILRLGENEYTLRGERFVRYKPRE